MARAAEAEKAAPAKRGVKGFIVLGLVALVATAFGFVLPRLVGMAGSKWQQTEQQEKEADGEKLAFISFDPVVVNINEERLTRFLRVKLIIVVDKSQEKQIAELVQRNKAILKNWLISHLSDKAMLDVTGAAGINRSRREIQDRFNELLFADGSEKIRDILFEEFNVQ